MKSMLKWLRLITVFVMLVQMAPAFDVTSVHAAEQDDVTLVRDKLATALQSIGEFGLLSDAAQALPLTSLDPAAEGALRLAKLFDSAVAGAEGLSQRVSNISATTFSAFQTALNNLDTGSDYGGVGLLLNSASAAYNGTNSNFIDITLPLQFTRQVNTPLSFSQSPLTLDGGSISVAMTLTAGLTFQLDKSLAADTSTAAQSLYVVGTPTLSVNMSSNATIGSFAATLGFADINAAGSANFNAQLNATLVDPDVNGRVTLDELASTAPDDLFNVGFVDAPGNDADINLNLSVGSSLVSTTPLTGSVTLVDNNFADGINITPTLSLGSLGDLANISADDALNGITQFAAGILSAQGAGDLKIPFTNARLSDALSLADKLTKFVKQQADAYVICGRTDTSPPIGLAKNLSNGASFYCRAIALQNPTSVTWTLDNGTEGSNTSGSGALNTVGVGPSVNASFTMTETGDPKLQVAFTDPDGTAHTAKLRFISLQDLKKALESALNLSPGSISNKYDSGKKYLTYQITRNETPGVYNSPALDFGSQISNTTGLIGLSPDSGAGISIEPNATLSITFGIITTKNAADITPGDDVTPSSFSGMTYSTSILDRFFVQVDPNSDEVSANAAVTANVKLKGNIGFLGVTAEGSTAANPGGGSAFVISKPVSTAPMLSLNINTPSNGIPISTTSGLQNIPNAIRIRELVGNLGVSISPKCNVGMSAGLVVSATVGNTLLGSGKVGINWPSVFNANSCTPNTSAISVTTDTNFNEQLNPFNVDSSNPQKLLGLLLDNLDVIANKLADLLQDSKYNKEIPVVGLKVSDLVRQAATLKKKLEILRTGGGNQPGLIFCDLSNGVDDAGTADDNQVANVTPGEFIYCRAQLPAPSSGSVTVNSVSWTITGGEPCDASTDPTKCASGSNKTNPATVGTSPTDAVVFKVTDPSGVFKVSLGYQTDTTVAAQPYTKPGPDNPLTTTTANNTADFPAEVVPSSLQDFGTKLEKILGLPAGSIRFEMKQLTGDSKKELVFRLKMGICTANYSSTDANAPDCSTGVFTIPTLSTGYNFKLGNSGGDLSFVGLQSNGSLALDFGAIAQLNGGVQLNGLSSSGFLLNSSNLKVGVKGGVENFSISANIGPIQASAGNGPTATAKAKLGVILTGGADVSNSNEGLVTDFSSLAKVNFAPEAVNCGTIDGNDVIGQGGCAVLPLTINSTAAGILTMTVTSITPTLQLNVVQPAGLLTALANAVLNFNTFFEGLNYVLDLLKSALRVSSYGANKAPLIGDDLSGGADIIEKFQTKVLDPLQDLVNKTVGLPATPPGGGGDNVRDCVHDILYASLHNATTTIASCSGSDFSITGPPVDLLLDISGNNTLGPEDVVVTPFCGTAVCGSGATAATITDLNIVMRLGQSATAGSAFDLGVPGFRLRSVNDPTNPNNGKISGTVQWSLDMRFGISRTVGFYFAPMKTCTGGSCSGNLDQTAGLNVSASLNLPASMKAELGFLEANITNNHSTPDLSVSAGVKFGPGATPTAISIASLKKGFKISDFGPSFQFTSDIDMQIKTSLRGGEKAGFPSVQTDFNFGYGFCTGSGCPGNSNFGPRVAFENVGLDPGSFLKKFLAPVVKEVKRVTGPVQPVVDIVQTEIPGISDLSKLVGQGPVTMLTIIETGCGCDLTLVRRIIGVINFVNSINPDAVAEGTFIIPLGGFSLDASKVNNSAPTPDQADSLIASSAISNTNFKSNLGDMISGGTLAQAYGITGRGTDLNIKDPDTKNKTGLEFPFLDQPSQIFGLLLGKDIDLIAYDTGRMTAKAGVSYNFPPIFIGPIPVAIGVFGRIELNARFRFGYDSSGLRKVLKEGSSGEHIFDGIFADDLYQGQDINEVELIGEIGASASVSLLVVSAGVEAGIRLTVGLNLHDDNGDGKIRIDEVFNKLANPICLFDISGKLSFFLAAFVKIDFFFFSKTWRFPIVDITLLDFTANNLCSPPNPVLAQLDTKTLDGGSRKVLRVNVGPNKAARGIQTGDVDEKVTIRELKRRFGSTDKVGFSVSMFGAYQEFFNGENGLDLTNLYAIYVDGSDPSGATNTADDISFENGTDTTISPTVPYTFTARTFTYTGSGSDTVTGGEGPDYVEAGAGNDKVNGGGGDDVIYGDSASDASQSGQDVLNGDDGNDTLYGGPDNDGLSGGKGNDKLDGNAGDDNLDGNEGNDTLIGSDGKDGLTGGPGADIVNGDSDLSGAAGLSVGSTNFHTQQVRDACALNGGSSGDNDLLEGGDDGDVLFAGPGDDELQGGAGDDVVCGNSGKDLLKGDNPNDATQKGDDYMNGGPGNDELRGGPNTSATLAAAGANAPNSPLSNPNPGLDVLLGGSGNDLMFGDDGPDVLIGGSGRDILNGGSDGSNDLLVGDTGSVADHSASAQATGTLTSVYQLVTVNDTLVADTATGSVNCNATTADGISGSDGSIDCMNGGAGNDVLVGEAGNDQMNGDAGNDYMHGNSGADTMRGGQNDDIMYGDAGADAMFGDSGDDQMLGGTENDAMRGGIGNDNMQGDNGVDTMNGDAGNDIMHGNADGDFMYGDGNNDRMFGDGGNDTMQGNDGDDYMQGNAGTDTMNGNAGQDDMIGGSSTAGAADAGDSMYGDGDQDVMLGGNGEITRGNLSLIRDFAQRRDTIRLGADALEKPAPGRLFDATVARRVQLYDTELSGSCTSPSGTDDTMFGGAANDQMFGENGNDLMYGQSGDDHIEGNAAADTIQGGAGEDDLIGGTGRTDTSDNSSADNGRCDGVDNIYGGDTTTAFTGDYDVIAGDNATIDRTAGGADWVRNTFNNSVKRDIHLYDVATGSGAQAGTGAGDNLYGESGDDLMYGQGGDDQMHGGAGDDYMEGNAASDTMYGDAGQDDMIGGTGRSISNNPASALPGRLDGSDTIYGGDGSSNLTGDFDTIAGDNATIDREIVQATGLWKVNTFNAAVSRNLVLYDVATVTSAPLAGTSDGDFLYGENNDDTMYGQGGNDTMSGGAGDDYMEGNSGADTMDGNSGNDDMVGGTGRITTVVGGVVTQDPATGTPGRVDAAVGSPAAGDTMNGNDGFDFMSGDNAIIVRTLVGGQWVANPWNAGIQHNRIRLLDIDSSNLAQVSAGDRMNGDNDDDVMYGQGGGDVMRGNAGDDYMEGNAGGDNMRGGAGQDDMVGGTGRVNDDPATGTDGRLDANDIMYGEGDTADPTDPGTDNGSGADVMDGDNAVISRTQTITGAWATNTFNGAVTRSNVQLDVQCITCAAAPDGVHGDDMMWGNSGDDSMWGEAGDDMMYGGAGQDYMEGNADTDTMFGQGNQDDMIGGTARTNTLDASSARAGRYDGTDYMFGDSQVNGSSLPSDSHDVMLGDNGVITRPLTTAGAWSTQTYSSTSGMTTRVVRNVASLDVTTTNTLVFGSDYMRGNGADDEMYGQFDYGPATPLVGVQSCNGAGVLPKVEGDAMCGDAGDDAMLGDQGVVTDRVETGPARIIRINAPFIQETVTPPQQLSRLVELTQLATGGNDNMQGGTGDDWMHGGAGNDLMNGNAGDDRIFGDDGGDAAWGGTGHDHLYGGYGEDFLDVQPREAMTSGISLGVIDIVEPADPPEWFITAPYTDTFQQIDYIYGGWDRDVMQANIGNPGPVDGDRMIDWVGAYNLYFICPGAYGEFAITRMHSPSMQQYLIDQATYDGGKDVSVKGSSGFDELGLVYTTDIKDNSGSAYPGQPGHFTCGIAP